MVGLGPRTWVKIDSLFCLCFPWSCCKKLGLQPTGFTSQCTLPKELGWLVVLSWRVVNLGAPGYHMTFQFLLFSWGLTLFLWPCVPFLDLWAFVVVVIVDRFSLLCSSGCPRIFFVDQPASARVKDIDYSPARGIFL